MSDSRERRTSPRCVAVENQSRLEFAARGGRQRVSARVMNISRDGALVVTEDPPPCGEPIWLRIESPVKTDWAKAVTVRVGRSREFAVRFPMGCPDDLLMAGTIGINMISSFFDTTRSESFGDVEV
jgi:PilZ domain